MQRPLPLLLALAGYKSDFWSLMLWAMLWINALVTIAMGEAPLVTSADSLDFVLLRTMKVPSMACPNATVSRHIHLFYMHLHVWRHPLWGATMAIYTNVYMIILNP